MQILDLLASEHNTIMNLSGVLYTLFLEVLAFASLKTDNNHSSRKFIIRNG